MVSGADLSQALVVGLWEALDSSDDRAAVRATCTHAKGVADMLHGKAVMPAGPGTWDSAASMAAFHRQLGTVHTLHVRYSGGGGGDDDVRAAQFLGLIHIDTEVVKSCSH